MSVYIEFDKEKISDIITKYEIKDCKLNRTKTYNYISFISEESDIQVLDVPIGTWVMFSEKDFNKYYPNGRNLPNKRL